MQFRMEPIQLTMQVTVTKEENGKIGWKIRGFGASRRSAATQTLTLRLSPVWRKRDGSLTDDFAIAAVSPAGDAFGPRTHMAGTSPTSGSA
jgi:hypothetical protein